MVSTTGNGDVVIRIDGDESGLKDAAQRAADHLAKMERQAKSTSDVMDKLKGAMAGLGAVLGTAAVINYADTWSELNSRVNNAAGSMEKGTAVMNRLSEMARRTYSSISQTTESFLANSTTLDALGYSTKTQLDITEALNNALVISATKGQRAESVMSAWGKAMALGSLQGDNLNTVITGSDRLAVALAESMGVSVDKLREMGAKGEITAQKMAGVTSQLEKLRTEADEMPATIGDAMTLWNDALLVVVGTMDRATGASEGLATFLVDLADSFRNSADTAATLAIMVKEMLGGAISSVTGLFSGLMSSSDASMAAMAAGIGVATAAAVKLSVVMATQVVGAIRLVTAAMMANPLGLFVAGVAAAISAAYLFRDKIKDAIGVDSVQVMKDFANTTIGTMITAWDAVKSVWNNLPALFKEISANAANAFIAGIEWMVNKAVQGFNQIISAANAVASFFGADWVASNLGWGTGQFSLVDELELGRVETEAAGTLSKVGDEIKKAFTENTAVDYVGGLTSALGDMWQSAADANEEAKNLMATLDGEDNVKGGGAGGKDKGKGKKKKDRAEKMREQMKSRLEALKEGLMEEEELENAQYQKKLDELKKYWDERLLTEEEYHALVEKAKEQHEKKLVDIRKKAMQQEQQARSQMMGYVTSTLQSISQTMDSEGDKQIGIQKAISLAIAAINVAEGITKALSLPFPMNLAAAAATAAQGMAAIASISSTSRGNTGTLGGSGGAAAVQEVPQQMATPQSIYIQGIDRNSLYTGDAIYGIIDSLNEAVNNGAVIRTQPT